MHICGPLCLLLSDVYKLLLNQSKCYLLKTFPPTKMYSQSNLIEQGTTISSQQFIYFYLFQPEITKLALSLRLNCPYRLPYERDSASRARLCVR